MQSFACIGAIYLYFPNRDSGFNQSGLPPGNHPGIRPLENIATSIGLPGARFGASQPFSPVMEIPSMKLFWVKKNRAMIGRATRVLAAIR